MTKFKFYIYIINILIIFKIIIISNYLTNLKIYFFIKKFKFKYKIHLILYYF